MFGSFVPPFSAEPFFERMEVDFRVSVTKAGNVRCEASLIEPAEHKVELFARQESNERERKFLKFHRLS